MGAGGADDVEDWPRVEDWGERWERHALRKDRGGSPLGVREVGGVKVAPREWRLSPVA